MNFPCRRARVRSCQIALLFFLLGALRCPADPVVELTVKNVFDSGPNSLREAIDAANQLPTGTVATIKFDLPLVMAAPVITLQTPLPVITRNVFIDGSTRALNQSGQSVPSEVQLFGANLPAGSPGLVFDGGGLSGNQGADSLQVYGFPGEGVVFQNCDGGNLANSVITNCAVGVEVDNSSHVELGPRDAFEFSGIDDATLAAAGLLDDFSIFGGSVISGNSSAEIKINGGSHNTIRGNHVGSDITGMSAAGSNQLNGIQIVDSGVNVISRNLIIGHGTNNTSGGGAEISVSSTDGSKGGNFIGRNYVGVNATGNVAISCFSGVLIANSPNNVIQRNVVSGTTAGAIVIQGAFATGNLVIGNFLGTNATGTAVLGSDFNAPIFIFGAPGNTIGGTDPTLGNLIAFTSTSSVGIMVSGGSGNVISGTVIQGNSIGTDRTGTLNLGSGSEGIDIFNAVGTIVGGSSPGAGNIIANAGTGIFVSGQAGVAQTQAAIRGNVAFAIGTIGIDLRGSFGVNNNDPGDADTGPNGLQNYPLITGAVTSAGVTTISGTLSSVPSAKTYQVDFFSSPTGSNFNRLASFYLGSTPVTTDVTGNGSFQFSCSSPSPVAAGLKITSTATDQDGNTSELSAPVAVTGTAAGADIELGGTVSQPVVRTGGTVTYTYTVRNLSGTASGAVSFTELLPAGLTFGSVSATVGFPVNSANVSSVSIPSLPAGGSATITEIVKVDATPPPRLVLTSHPFVSTSDPDPQLLNNSIFTSVEVELPAVITAYGLNAGDFTTQIDSYTGHTYRLQRTTSLGTGSFFSNVGNVQNGATGTTLTFTDPNTPLGKVFYRIVVDE